MGSAKLRDNGETGSPTLEILFVSLMNEIKKSNFRDLSIHLRGYPDIIFLVNHQH